VMNEATIAIAMNQFFSPFTLWMLVVFMTPIIAGAVTTHLCHKVQHKITMQVWQEWREDPEFQKQKVTSSINYNG
jgi:hypothetical protein